MKKEKETKNQNQIKIGSSNKLFFYYYILVSFLSFFITIIELKNS